MATGKVDILLPAMRNSDVVLCFPPALKEMGWSISSFSLENDE
jgi:hypothetical protein